MKKLFFGGEIITMDETNPQAEAVLVDGEIIEGVGSLSEMEALAGESVERIDLGGNVMMPGLIEPHAHLDLAAFQHKAHLSAAFSTNRPTTLLRASGRRWSRPRKGDGFGASDLTT